MTLTVLSVLIKDTRNVCTQGKKKNPILVLIILEFWEVSEKYAEIISMLT
jgi:hypothetical protein